MTNLQARRRARCRAPCGAAGWMNSWGIAPPVYHARPARLDRRLLVTYIRTVPYGMMRKGGAPIEDGRDSRAQQTRDRIRAAARRLFLQLGYQATTMDAIRVAAGVASKETVYRHYHSKEKLFIDVMGHLTMEQPGFSAMVAALPEPRDLPTLRQA